MNNNSLFLDIDRKYGRTALRLKGRHELYSRKLARYVNHENEKCGAQTEIYTKRVRKFETKKKCEKSKKLKM